MRTGCRSPCASGSSPVGGAWIRLGPPSSAAMSCWSRTGSWCPSSRWCRIGFRRAGGTGPGSDQLGLAYGVPYRRAQAVRRPAAQALEVSPAEAVPKMVRLTDGREDWAVRPDLLGSDRFEPAYVVEMDDGGQARLRFGDTAQPAAGSRRHGPGELPSRRRPGLGTSARTS